MWCTYLQFWKVFCCICKVSEEALEKECGDNAWKRQRKKDRISAMPTSRRQKGGSAVTVAHLLVGAIDAVARLRKNADRGSNEGNQEVLTPAAIMAKGGLKVLRLTFL